MKRTLLLASLALTGALPSCRSPQKESVASASLTPTAQTSVRYETPAFSAIFPPGTVVQVDQITSKGTPPLVWTNHQGIMSNDARLSVAYCDFPDHFEPITPDAQIDLRYNNMFVPGYSIKKEAGRLDTLPAVTAVVRGFGQGSETVQCHKCTMYEAHMVVGWSKSQRRLWMLQTLAEPNELSSDEAVKFFNSFKLK
jgi:hypothetical protein